MKEGSRVRTPHGMGNITQLRYSTEWAFNKPERLVWVTVQLDRGHRGVYKPEQLNEEKQMRNEEQTITIGDGTTITTSTDNEPDPNPDPKPEPTPDEPEDDEQ